MNTQQLETKLIAIDLIHPDPDQPRHLLPPDLAQRLENGTAVHEVLGEFRSRADRDRWIRERLAELDALARSVETDGLMQPLRVIPDGEGRYTIEEGERRWWAHQILVQQGKAQFQNVAAFVVEAPEVAGLLRRRVAENVLRSGFTAIELAKTMTGRIQEIMAAESGINRTEAERRVAAENGISDRRVRQFVALLTLSPEVQELAQRARLSENALRSLVGIQDTARQLAKARELASPPRKSHTSAKHSRTTKHRGAGGTRVTPKRAAKARRSAVGKNKRKAKRAQPGKSDVALAGDRSRPFAVILRELVSAAKEFQPPSVDGTIELDWTEIIRSPDDLDAVRMLAKLLSSAGGQLAEPGPLQTVEQANA